MMIKWNSLFLALNSVQDPLSAMFRLNLSTMASLGTEIIKWQLWGGRSVIMIPILWGKDTGSGRCSGEVAMH